MTDTEWTEPVDLVDGDVSDVDAFNAQVNGNLRHLHYAKAGTFGLTGAVVIPNETFVSLEWNFAELETVSLWSASPYPERITPSVGGLWLFTVRVQWPPTGGGAVSVRMQQQGVVTVGQDTRVGSTFTTYSTFSSIVEIDGAGDYVNFHAWQSTGNDVTINGGHRLDCVYLGAV